MQTFSITSLAHFGVIDMANYRTISSFFLRNRSNNVLTWTELKYSELRHNWTEILFITRNSRVLWPLVEK